MASDLTLDFPKADFGYIADIPKVAQDFQERQALQKTLADLKPNASPSELRQWADRAIALGTGSGIEAGVRLHNIAQQQENEAGRRLNQTAYLAWLAQQRNAPPAMAPGAEPTPNTVDFSVPAPAPAAIPASPPAMAVPGMPAAPGGAGELPPGVGVAPATPGPRTENIPPSLNAPMSPTEQVLSRTEAAAVPSVPPTRLAGPPPTPDTGPPAMAPQAPVPFMPGAVPGGQMTVVPGTESRQRIQAAPVPQPPGGNAYEQAKAEAASIRDKLMTMPPGGAAQPMGKVLTSQFNAALSRLKLPETEIAYQQELLRTQLDNRDRVANGLDPLPEPTRTDLRIHEKAAPDIIKGAYDSYEKDYKPAEKTARTLGQKLQDMKTIMDDPQFAVGESGSIAKAKTGLASWIQTLRAQGIPFANWISEDWLRAQTKPEALKEAFTSLANQSVTAALGGLSKSISDADRNYLASAYPALSQTREGMALIHEFLSKMADRMALEAKTARDYLNTNGERVSSPGMDSAVARKLNLDKGIAYNREKNGADVQTDLGRRMAEEEARIRAQTVPASPTAPLGRGNLTFPAAAEGKTVEDEKGNRFVIKGGMPTPIGK